MREKEEVILLLGGDRGELHSNMDRAAELLRERVGEIRAISRDHWSEAWGFQDDALFLNRAILLSTDLESTVLMTTLLEIERELGRVRSSGKRPGPRTMDIDILLMGDRVIEEPQLTVPHPRMHERRFALAPAADVAPSMRHPILGHTILELLDRVKQHDRKSAGHSME